VELEALVIAVWVTGRDGLDAWVEGTSVRHPGFSFPQSRTRQFLTSSNTSRNPIIMAAGNRKDRRAKDANPNGKSTGSAFQPSTELDEDAVNILLKHPDRSGPKGKTLFELAEERQKELDKAKPAGRNATMSKGPTAEQGVEEEVAIGPLGDAVLYSMSMAALHLTLDVIVYKQYREDILWAEIFKRAATAMPIFMLLVYLTHVDISYRFPLPRNLLFLAGSVAAGCYLVFAGNKYGYFNVMKAAPPLGALWIWSVIEMSLPYATLSVISVFAYLWWNQFSFF
jgi:hypothetical protein